MKGEAKIFLLSLFTRLHVPHTGIRLYRLRAKKGYNDFG